MNRIFYFFLTILLCISGAVSAQNVGNEWINFSQQYYRFAVSANGVYRVQGTQLQSSGFAAAVANPDRIQLFRRGTEVAITVAKKSDGTLDYLEFYGVRNDGSRDRELYVPEEAHTNPYMSLFADNSYYFITVAAAGQAVKRIEVLNNGTPGSLSAESYHLAEILRTAAQDYGRGPSYYSSTSFSDSGILLSQFGVGNGYIFSVFGAGGNNTQTFNLSNSFIPAAGDADQASPSAEFSVYGSTSDYHNVDVQAGTASTFTTMKNYLGSNYILFKDKLNIPWDKFTSTQASVRVKSNQGNGAALVYLKLIYPQVPTLSDIGTATGKAFNLRANAGNKSYLKISNSTNTDRLFDISDIYNVKQITSSSSTAGSVTSLEAVVNETSNGKNLWIARATTNITSVTRVDFTNINPAQYDYLILTHKTLLTQANNYSDYRASAQGGGYKPLVIEMDQVSNQFNYGENSVLGIRHFVEFMLRQGPAKHLFVIGAGVVPQYHRFVYNETAFANVNLVPTGGWPGSDLLLVSGLNGKPRNVPALAIGRLNVTSPAKVTDYLNKVKAYESQPMDLWKKKIIQLSGGKIAPYSESEIFYNYAKTYKGIIEQPSFGGKTNIIQKTTSADYQDVDIAADINSGVSMITFFGHSSTQYTDMRIGLATESRYTANGGKFPILFVSGCEAGNCFDPNSSTVGGNWIETPNKGAILFLASTFNGWPSPLHAYNQILFKKLNAPGAINKTFGTLMVETNTEFISANPNDPMTIGHTQEFVLQGDPAIIPYPITKPDFAVTSSSLSVATNAAKDSLNFKLIVANLGSVPSQNMEVSLSATATNAGGRTTAVDLGTFNFSSVKFQDTLSINVKNTLTGNITYTMDAVVDPLNKVDEVTKANNATSVAFEVPVPLPVTLVYFKGQIEKKSSRNVTGIDLANVPDNIGVLTWKVAEETDIRGYSIERSADARNWTSIGYVSSKNRTSDLYTFADTKLQIGNNYYRLKIDEISAPEHYSKIIALNLPSTYDLTTYPNPATSSFTITLKENPGAKAQPVDAYLYNMAGQMIWKGSITNGSLKVSTGDIANGTYHLQVNDGTSFQLQKVVIQH